MTQKGSGGTIITGQAIALYRLLALQSAIELEAKGMRSRFGSRTAQAKRELGLQPRARRELVLQKLGELIAAKRAEVAVEGVEQADLTIRHPEGY